MLIWLKSGTPIHGVIQAGRLIMRVRSRGSCRLADGELEPAAKCNYAG